MLGGAILSCQDFQSFSPGKDFWFKNKTKDSCIACLAETFKYEGARYPTFTNMPTDSDHNQKTGLTQTSRVWAELPWHVEGRPDKQLASTAESIQHRHAYHEVQHHSLLYSTTRFVMPDASSLASSQSSWSWAYCHWLQQSLFQPFLFSPIWSLHVESLIKGCVSYRWINVDDLLHLPLSCRKITVCIYQNDQILRRFSTHETHRVMPRADLVLLNLVIFCFMGRSVIHIALIYSGLQHLWEAISKGRLFCF